MLHEYHKLEKEIQALQSQILDLPDGKLVCTRNGNRYKWYHRNDHGLAYIPKTNQRLAEQLSIKKYLSLLSSDLLNERKAISLYLNYHNAHVAQAEQMLIETSGYQKLLSSYFQPLSKELFSWANSDYQHNIYCPDQLNQKTSSNTFVRSKSEAMIDMMLHTNKIPFRYECALELDSTTIFPDFTIRHPETGDTYYWEHFGLMDQSNYCKKAYAKLQLYTANGIIPSINLITTFETTSNPLNLDLVEKIIHYYFM